MPLPFIVTVNGTGTSAIYTPDRLQNPFNIGIGVNVTNTGGGVGWRIEHTFDPLDNATATVTNWLVNSAIGTQGSAAYTSLVLLDMNYAYAVTGIRLNVGTATATSSVTASINQSSNAP
jgi:hypothetical protein